MGDSAPGTNAGIEERALCRQRRYLPGNIRYMACDGFVWDTPDAARSVAAAMALLRGGDAYIVDLRRNGGGSPDAVAAISSYFVAPERPLMRFEARGEPPAETRTSEVSPLPTVGPMTERSSMEFAHEPKGVSASEFVHNMALYRERRRETAQEWAGF